MPAPYINTMVTFLPDVSDTWRLVKILIQYNTENIRLIFLFQTIFFFSTSCLMVRENLIHLDTQNFPLACGWQM